MNVEVPAKDHLLMKIAPAGYLRYKLTKYGLIKRFLEETGIEICFTVK